MIRAALGYSAAYTTEVDASIEQEREFAEREEQAWLRQRELLG